MNHAILEISNLWHEIAESAPKSLNGRSVNEFAKTTGNIGELAVAAFMAACDVPFDHIDDYDYDFMVNGLRIDVKTNANKHLLEPYHHIMLTDYLRNQDCDIYIFAAVSYELNIVQIMGYCEKQLFWQSEHGRDLKKGEKVSVTPVKEDARLLAYRHIHGIYDLADYLEQHNETDPICP